MDLENQQLNTENINFKDLFSHIKSADHLNSILGAVADGITVQDQQGKLVYANDAAAKVMGFSNQLELLNTPIATVMQNFELYDGKNNPFPLANLPGRKALAGEDCSDVIVRWVYKKTGQSRWSQIKATPIRDLSGKVLYAVNIFHDLTQQKEVEENLSKINRRNKHILESITDGFLALNTKLEFTYINQQAAPYFPGKSPEELLGKNILEEFPVIRGKKSLEMISQSLAEGRSLQYEEYFDHLRRWVDISTYPSKDGISIYFRDVTERKMVQEANAKLAAIVESSDDAIVGKTLDGIITSWNQGAKSIYGYAPEEMIGKNISLLLPPDLPNDMDFIMTKIRRGESLEHYETRRKTKDGRIIDVALTVSPIKDTNGNIIGASSVARDITELKLADKTQEFLIEANSLLTSSLDYQTTLSRLAKLAVPKFGDWCSVELLNENGDIETVAVQHINPDKIKLAIDFRSKYPIDIDADMGVAKVIKTGKPEFLSLLTDEMIRMGVQDVEHYYDIKQLGIVSYMIVPLNARRKTLGAITFVWAESNYRYTDKDLAIAEELATRAAIAVDNAILYKTAIKEVEERRRISQELELSEERYRSLISATTSIIWITDPEGKFVSPQPSWEDYTGQTYDEYRDFGWINAMHQHDRDEIMASWKKALDNKLSYESTGRLWNARLKQYRHFVSRSIPLRNEDGSIREWIGSINDIDDRKKAEDQLKYQFHHDFLTDLPNRTYLNEQVNLALVDAQINHKVVALMLLDLDRFKNINESLGHAIGDRLIQEVSLRIQACTRDEFTVARLGGDEFGILMPNIDKEEDAAKLAMTILSEFRPMFTLDAHELYVSPSLGISLYPYDGRVASDLFRNAETALYRAKEQGRNTYQFYTSSLNASSFEKLNLESKLRRALENNEFVLFYQPQIDVETGKVVGTEALIRWQRSDMTLVLPDQFIPLAEANGLIEQIGLWTLKEAMNQAKIWHDRGHKITMAVNLSPRQLKQKQFDHLVLAAVEESGFDPNYLELELTESVFADNADNVVRIMNILRERGIKFCLDDFSTGYSSLRYIKQFPVDRLKIERNFLKGIPHDVQNSAIAKSIITLGQTLGMEITAEGVESKKQLAFLRTNLCNRAQGYLFNGAMPGNSLTEILGEDRYVTVINSLNRNPQL